MRHYINPFVLAGTYLIVIGSMAAADLGVAFAVGIITTLLSHPKRLLPGRKTLRALVWLPWLVLGTCLEVFHGSRNMFLVLLGLRPWQNIGYVEISVSGRSMTAANINALINTMSPGSVLVDFDTGHETMLFNVIDADHPQNIQNDMNRFYERYQKAAIP